MAVDISRQNAKGGDPQFDTGALRGVREERGIVTGIVKANVHRMQWCYTNLGAKFLVQIPTIKLVQNSTLLYTLL